MMSSQKTKKLMNNEFIILEYLLKETSVNNPKKYIDYIEYARDKYNVFFDPRTVATTLESFYQLSKENADYFPFKIGAKGNKARKYYCEKIIFNEEDTKTFINSIRRNKDLSIKEKFQLMQTFLNILTPKDYRDSYKGEKAIVVTQKKASRYFRKLKWYHSKQCPLLFKVSAPEDCHSYTSLSTDTIYHGFIYKILEVNDETDVAILTSDHMIAMIVPIDALVVVSQIDEVYDKKQPFDYYINIDDTDSKYDNMHDFIDDFLNKCSNRKFGELILTEPRTAKSFEAIKLTLKDEDYYINKAVNILALNYPLANFVKATQYIETIYETKRDKLEKHNKNIVRYKNTIYLACDIDYFVKVYFQFASMECNPIIDIKPDYIKKVILAKMEHEHNHISKQLGGK